MSDSGLTNGSSSDLPKKSIRFLHLSDIHFGAQDDAALRQMEEFAAAIKPDAILVAGDITQTGARDQFVAARAWFQSLKIPVLVTPGNHDTPVYHLAARVVAPFKRYEKYMEGFDVMDRLAEFGDGMVRISAINTARGWQKRLNWADGVVDMDDLDAALDQLKGGPKDAWRVLLCHHPLVQPGHAKISVETLRGEEALRRCTAARVDAILTGHIHDAFAHYVGSDARPIVQMGSGTLSIRLRATRPSFCVLEMTADRMIQEVVTLDRVGVEIRRNYDSAGPLPGTLPADGR